MGQTQNFRWQQLTMGTCYYPEHWDPALWEQDLDRMLDVGISVIRIAEFAWNKVEPEEGVFTFDFFDTFLDLCSRKGMKVIFGTPTATPPAWLTEAWPEVLNADREGVYYRHGSRRHYNYNSPVYRRLAARIVEQEAKHFGPHPAIVGWQIDNELNCEKNEFYSEADTEAFRVFLKKKYRTIERLNEAWGTVFWNQTYTDWEQVHLLRPIPADGVNPHQHLDYLRFISDSTISFCRMQAELIRKYRKPGDFIMTNGMFGNLDNYRMQRECLDVYTYDSYPNFAYGIEEEPNTSTDLNDRKWSRNLTEVRSVCPHFGIMEQQSGANGWTTRMEAAAPRPGQLTLWAMQSVAQGADMISFFRWRTCTVGTEIYWHGILDYDNRDNRRLREVRDFYQKLRSIDAVCGAGNVAAFALIKDYDNVWDAQVDAWHRRVSTPSEKEIFAAAEQNHTPYDMVYLQEDSTLSELERYPVAFYPHPVLMDEHRAALLGAYVRNGGTLIIGCRAGYKDMNGRCVMLPQPGLLQELTGTDVRDFTFASPAEEPVWARRYDSGNTDASTDRNADETEREHDRIRMPVFCDILTPLSDTRVLAVYANSYFAGEAAITEHKLGAGRVIHFGSTFTRESVKRLFAYTGILEPFAAYIDAPEEAEVVLRQKEGKEYLFVLNFQPHEITCILKKDATLMYTGKRQTGEFTLPAYGTAVYEVSS